MSLLEHYRAFAAAFNRRDLDGIGEMVTDDFEIESRFSSVAGRRYRGRDAIPGWWEDLADAWEEMSVEVEDGAETGPGRLVATCLLHGCGRGSGVELHEPIAHRTHWRGERMAKLEYMERDVAERIVRR